MMRAFIYDQGGASEHPFAECLERYGHVDLVWLHLDGSEAEAREWVQLRSGLPPHAQEALSATETRPRVDLTATGAIINLRGPGVQPDAEGDALVSIRFWVEAGRVVSFAYREPAALAQVVDTFLAARLHDPGDLIAAFAQHVSVSLDGQIAELGDTLDTIEVELDVSRTRPLRRRVSRIRGDAISFRRFIVPQREALERLAGSELGWLEEQDRIHLRSAADRFARMAEELEAVRERATIVHDELTDLRGELIDSRSLLISIVAMIFLPLTFITGLLGMNVKGIPYAEAPWAFWGVVGFCVATGIGVLAWFAWAHWIQDDDGRD